MNTYQIGPLTAQHVFKAANLTNMSDMQAVMDAVEWALIPLATAKEFIDKHHVSCPEATTNDGVYEEAHLLVEALAEVVGYYEYPEDND